MTKTAPRLSKSRYVAGCQCPKLLWWTVHDPDADVLQPDLILRDLFEQGHRVGERAQAEWPNGVLIEGGHHDPTRIPRTMAAIEAGATVLFEACFEQDNVFCAIDVLEKNGDCWTLIEVKSSTSVKDIHIPDLAVQTHVARQAGLHIGRVEVMHLNTDYRYPGPLPLFTRSDVTARVEDAMPEVAGRIKDQLQMLKGDLPHYDVGPHCFDRDCPFMDRCWPEDSGHIRHLIGVGPKTMFKWLAKGIQRMTEVPADTKLNVKQKRQLRSQQEKRLIVEPGLTEALRPALEARRLGFLDFETVARAIPAWNGVGPWRNVAAQYSYHERQPDGTVTHDEFLAEGPPNPSLPPDDPREPLARRMLEATKNADLVVMYTPFEKTRIKELAEHLPHLAEPLMELSSKLWDLNPVVANNVYHPDFMGSFSLKAILTPLVPDMTYNDLIIYDGKTASVEIARLLFVSGAIPVEKRAQTRRDLLAYCKQDTFATVRLVEKLAELAGSQGLRLVK